MDKVTKNGETAFSKKMKSYFLQSSVPDNLFQRALGNGEERPCKTNGQTLRNFLKKQKEKRKKAEEKTEKNGEVSDSMHLETIHVRRVYNQIAPHIQDLKQKTWPRVKEFLKSLKPGSLVADVGCGNGRYLHINPSIIKIGSDICHPFLHSASSRGFEVLLADNLLLPYRDNIFDAVISVGVIHHFASRERRIQALQELARIVCPGGLLMVYVWAFEQKYRKFDSQDILVPWHEPRKSDHGRRKTRVSSLPDLDRLSTSSTGSSLSDEDFTTSSCLQLSLHADTNKGHQSPPLEHQCGTELQGETKGQALANVRNVASHDALSNIDERSRCAEDGVHQNHLDLKLARAEALIRECQKVESYLSSLCKHTIGSLPEKSKSLSSMPSRCSPLGSFEEVVLNGTEKSSPSCQSLSFQDDDVFFDKTDSPVLDSPRPLTRSSQKKLLLDQYILGDSVMNEHPPLRGDSQETQDDNFIRTVHQPPAVVRGSIDSLDSSTSSREMGSLEGHKGVDRSVLDNRVDGRKLPALKQDILFKQGARDRHSSADDDFCFIEVEADLSAHAPFSSRGHNVSLPRSVLGTLKQGLRNIFKKTKGENGRHAARCLVPCVVPSFPPEHFQVREFPQSSLPKGTMLERDMNHSSGNQVSKSGSDSALSFRADESRDDAVQICQKFDQNFSTPAGQLQDHIDDSISQNSSVFESIDIAQLDLISTVAAEKSKNSDNHVEPQPEINQVKVGDVADNTVRSNSDTAGAVPQTEISQQNTDANARTPSAPGKCNAMNKDLCRFYHVFREGELESLVTQHLPGMSVLHSFYDHANWCLILQKL